MDDVRKVYQLLPKSDVLHGEQGEWVWTSPIPILIVMSRNYVPKHTNICVRKHAYQQRWLVRKIEI